MAAATFPPPSFLTPLLALAAWLMRPLQSGPAPAPLAATPPSGQRSAHAPSALRAAADRRTLRTPRIVRVVRVVEGSDRAGAGRMVISGRMADVCAELDRLAAQEARRH